MLQNVATIISLTLGLGAFALIAGMLADDWRGVIRALRNASRYRPLSLAVQPRVIGEGRRARVVCVSPQSAPRRAAA